MPPITKEQYTTLRSKPSKFEDFNYFKLARTVKERNIFNAEGKLADEGMNNTDKPSTFDLTGPCMPSTLPLQIKGTMVAGKESRTTIVHKQTTHFLKEGEAFPDLPHVQVILIHEQGVVLKNRGKKECLYLVKGINSLSAVKKKTKQKKEALALATSASSNHTLSSDWVEKQLGPSFGTIMNNIYTVPEVDHNNGQILGYKLHGVRKGDLFSKMNLKSNDIITSVNGQSMQKSNILSL